MNAALGKELQHLTTSILWPVKETNGAETDRVCVGDLAEHTNRAGLLMKASESVRNERSAGEGTATANNINSLAGERN